MPGTPFSHANLTETAHALYGRSWERALARDLNIPLRTVKSWFKVEPMPDLRARLADLCRQRGVEGSQYAETRPQARKPRSTGMIGLGPC